MDVQTATYGDACVITTWRLGLWVPLVDHNSGPSLFMNWIKQYFASGLQNYWCLFSSDYGHYGHTKRLYFMGTVNTKISEQRAKAKARWKKKNLHPVLNFCCSSAMVSVINLFRDGNINLRGSKKRVHDILVINLSVEENFSFLRILK